MPAILTSGLDVTSMANTVFSINGQMALDPCGPGNLHHMPTTFWTF